MDAWSWLWDQAKVASPFVAVFCLAWTAILWRRHIQDQRTIESMHRSSTRALLSSAKSMNRLGTSIQRLSDQIRNIR